LLKDGDVKGAVRLLCSDDKLAMVNSTTPDELKGLHPSATDDLQPVPIHSPLQVCPLATKTAIQSSGGYRSLLWGAIHDERGSASL
jgi:hypothetical protein